MRILVTGGAGFIGSNFVRHLRAEHPEDEVTVLDKLTYAGNLANLDGVSGVEFIRGDICDREPLRDFLARHPVDAVVHFCAESHVDRSIHGAEDFVRTNVLGTQVLLDAVREVGVQRFIHVSTDEVMGDLGPEDPPFTEESPIQPRSPYAASKAGGEMLVLAAHRTHGFPVVVVRPSNNYGPFQHIEKFVPTAILRAIAGQEIPVYGDGLNVRDWLYVEDCCRAIDLALRRGSPGEVYCVGSSSEVSNLAVARRVIDLVGGGSIRHVVDRPGHDRRYAVCADKMREIGWRPRISSFVEGLRETVRWYLDNEAWWRPILSGEYRQWVDRNYVRRGDRP